MSERYVDRPVTAGEAAADRARLRWPGDGLDHGFSRPNDVEPLASRLERATRVQACREMTYEMLADLHANWPSVAVTYGVWVKGLFVDFLAFTWKGVFLIWSIDHRWTTKQAAMVMPARAQIQREMGDWPGKVEAIFHSPREGTGDFHHIAVDQCSSEPVDIWLLGGRIDQLLIDWKPATGTGLDPEWIRWLGGASPPRWWRSAEGYTDFPEVPPHERL